MERKQIGVLPVSTYIAYLCHCITTTRYQDRLLMPAFGAQSVRGMFEDMKDICGQLLLKVRVYELFSVLALTSLNSGNGKFDLHGFMAMRLSCSQFWP